MDATKYLSLSLTLIHRECSVQIVFVKLTPVCILIDADLMLTLPIL